MFPPLTNRLRKQRVVGQSWCVISPFVKPTKVARVSKAELVLSVSQQAQRGRGISDSTTEINRDLKKGDLVGRRGKYDRGKNCKNKI